MHELVLRGGTSKRCGDVATFSLANIRSVLGITVNPSNPEFFVVVPAVLT
jgi:hypothetical protein